MNDATQSVRHGYACMVRFRVLALTALASGIFCGTTSTHAQAPHSAPIASPAAPTTAGLIESRTGWIVYEDHSYTPVLDDVSRQLEAARAALGARAAKPAAAYMQAAAAGIVERAALVSSASGRWSEAQKRVALEDSARMTGVARTMSAAAAAIANGRIRTTADLDAMIDKTARADIERRWIMADVTQWYPAAGQAQRHLVRADDAFARQHYEEAAAETRKASSYLRLEAARCRTGSAREALASATVMLDDLASSMAERKIKHEYEMHGAFAHATRALALTHEHEASELWTHEQLKEAGYTLKATAKDLESAVRWVDGQEATGPAEVVAKTLAFGDKLISGVPCTSDEATHVFDAVQHAIGPINAARHDTDGITKAVLLLVFLLAPPHAFDK